VAEVLITKGLGESYFRDSHIRAKCLRWQFNILPGHLEKRFCCMLHNIKSHCPPRVLSCYFETVWNGRVTHERMKGVIGRRICLLGCGWGDDSILHHPCCSICWHLLNANWPDGPGVQASGSRDAALLMDLSLSNRDSVTLSTGLHALYCTVSALRFSTELHLEPVALLRVFARRGMGYHMWRMLGDAGL